MTNADTGAPSWPLSPKIIIAEFFHPYFGWLNYDREFASEEAARVWLQAYQCTPYTRHRVRVLNGDGTSRVAWTDATNRR